MRRWKDESGQAFVMAVLFMIFLLAFMALAVDVGILFRARRNVQMAADAAAVAAATNYKYNYAYNQATGNRGARRAALYAAKANGYTNGTGGVVVNEFTPNYGPYVGCSACAEVTIKAPNPTFFMGLFHFNNIDVTARAVAGRQWENCVFALGGGVTNSGVIQLNNCGLIDDGSLVNSGTLTANAVSVTGSVSGGGTTTPVPQLGIAAVSDPLGLPAPSFSGCSSLPTSGTIGPGCYNGGTYGGSGSVTLSGGSYIINGPLDLSGSTLSISGSGVTIFFNNTFTIGSGVTLNLSARTTGQYNGVLFYNFGSNGFSLNGSSGSTLEGIIYSPNAPVDVSNANNMQLYTVFVAKGLTDSGWSPINVKDYLSVNPSAPPSLRTVALLE